jgi:ABC-type enterochelin transport system permease subunit
MNIIWMMCMLPCIIGTTIESNTTTGPLVLSTKRNNVTLINDMYYINLQTKYEKPIYVCIAIIGSMLFVVLYIIMKKRSFIKQPQYKYFSNDVSMKPVE